MQSLCLRVLLFDPEDGGCTIFRIIGERVPEHGVISQNMVQVAVTAMKTSNSTKYVVL
jgi:hypothetical protein